MARGKTKGSKTVNDAVRNVVAGVIIDYPDFTAKELKRETEKRFKKKGYKYHFTERTYWNIKSKLSSLDKDLDKPWSIGACEQYDYIGRYDSQSDSNSTNGN